MTAIQSSSSHLVTMVTKMRPESGYAIVFAALRDAARASLLDAPPTPPGYSEPATLLDAILAHKKYGKLLLEHDPLLKEYVDQLLNPDHRVALQILHEQDTEIADLKWRLDCALAAYRDAEERLWQERRKDTSWSAVGRVLLAAIAKAFPQEIRDRRFRTSIAQDLSDEAMRSFGMTLDPKTVRKHVNDAFDTYRANEL